jgi:acyl carrier protein
VHTTAYAPTDLAGSVALIFEEVLGISMVKGGDDFFDLGGDSLSASQLLARIREVFMVSPPLTTIFETPTVDGLADLLAELMARDPRSTTDDDIQEDIRELDK